MIYAAVTFVLIASGFYFDRFRDLFTMYKIFIFENWLPYLFTSANVYVIIFSEIR